MTPLCRRCALGFVIAIGAVAGDVLAGPLDPPAGPITPTYKTLTQVEPRTAVSAANTPGDADSLFKITQPGSYYLTGSITGVAGKHGIEITTSGVTLDLNGFDLAGVAAMGAFDGVSVTVDSLRNITILNAAVTPVADGADLGFLSFGCRVEGVLASGNAGNGINAGVSAAVSNCTASFNTLSGIRTNNGSTISHCSAYSNTLHGIQVNNACTVSSCSASTNSAIGILAGTACSVIDAASSSNTGAGIQLAESSAANRCTSVSNAGRGISVTQGCTVADCIANFNALDGISTLGGCTISGCTARSNTLDGIATGSNAVIHACGAAENGRTGISAQGAISNCFVSDNDDDGISIVAGSIVTDCAAYSNSGSGIRCIGAGSTIRGNTCDFNGRDDGAGITCNGASTRIEGNNCANADRGIDVGVGGNIIIRNTCKGNTTDWVIVAGNLVGPILDRRNPGGAAINGFSSPTNLNTTDPHANFSY